MPQLVPVSFERHGAKYLTSSSDWSFASHQHLVPLLTAEFPMAAKSLPIVFAGPDEELSCFALLGLKPEENLFVDDEGQWLGNYIPAFLRRYPFALVRAEKGTETERDTFVLCIDEQSNRIVDQGGIPFFYPDGKPSSMIERTQSFLSKCQRQQEHRQEFCKRLRELDLFETIKINFSQNDQAQELKGLHQVCEEKLQELPDSDFLGLRDFRNAPPLFAHLFSLDLIKTTLLEKAKLATEQTRESTSLPDRFLF